MANNDYQLEELENEAVNKSTNAKRIALGAGLLAAGAGSAYAATTLMDSDDADGLSEEDLASVAEVGADQVPEAYEAPVAPAEVHEHVVLIEQPVILEPVQEEPEQSNVEFVKTTHIYDKDGNLIMTTQDGKVDGHDFRLIDGNNDHRADILAIDVNGNHVFEEDEVFLLGEDDHITMDNPTAQHDDIFVDTPDDGQDENLWNDIDGKYSTDEEIHNDFDDEKSGEVYKNDYAENNPNYENNAPVEDYTADADRYDTMDVDDYTAEAGAGSYDTAAYGAESYDTADTYAGADAYEPADSYVADESNYMAMDDAGSESYDTYDDGGDIDLA